MFCFIFISFVIYFIPEKEKEEKRIWQSNENGVWIPTTKIYGLLWVWAWSSSFSRRIVDSTIWCTLILMIIPNLFSSHIFGPKVIAGRFYVMSISILLLMTMIKKKDFKIFNLLNVYLFESGFGLLSTYIYVNLALDWWWNIVIPIPSHYTLTLTLWTHIENPIYIMTLDIMILPKMGGVGVVTTNSNKQY